jgi:hypothetical protein
LQFKAVAFASAAIRGPAATDPVPRVSTGSAASRRALLAPQVTEPATFLAGSASANPVTPVSSAWSRARPALTAAAVWAGATVRTTASATTSMGSAGAREDGWARTAGNLVPLVSCLYICL